MTRHWRSLLPAAALAVTATLAACSHDKPPPPAAQAATPPQPTVLDPQLRALQKAKDVQKVVDQQAAEQDKQVEEQGK